MSATQALSNFATQSTATATTSSPTLQVVCAWPISSNYGAGSRILYYVLVAACVTFRKAEWLRNTCLAAVLILPAISALQALVLASAHANGGVDMDIYGAFQFCAIGILAAPLTVRLSRTYFQSPGRNIIFLWTILILMGLLALCVEFYRVTPTACSSDDDGIPFGGAANFPYEHARCSLTCSEGEGPRSPMRGGSSADVYVIPVPRILSFNAAMLLSAGLCIPAILSLIFTWDKILEINWKRRRHVEPLNARIEGANMTVGELKGINNVVRKFLGVIEIPLFGGVIITIIGVGEANFFSPQVLFMTEPMASIGQWSPIAGTIMAALGSLYILWSTDGDEFPKRTTMDHYENSGSSGPNRSSERGSSPQRQSPTYHVPGGTAGCGLGTYPGLPNDIELTPTITYPDSKPVLSGSVSQENQQDHHQTDQPTAGRNRMRTWLTRAANYLGDAAHDKLDPDHERNDEGARGFPEIPGENLRNPELEQITRTFSKLREERENSVYAASVMSTPGIGGSSSPPPMQEFPRPETSPSRQPQRRDTLEVPKETHGAAKATD